VADSGPGQGGGIGAHLQRDGRHVRHPAHSSGSATSRPNSAPASARASNRY
jgi:hypothetical protein